MQPRQGVYVVGVSAGRGLPALDLTVPGTDEGNAFTNALSLLRIAQPGYTGPIYGAGYPFRIMENQQ